jgi:hypothetical protein
MSESTNGPVEILGVAFGPDVQFEGRIADELDRLEQSGSIRVLDFVFLHRSPDTGELLTLDFEAQTLAGGHLRGMIGEPAEARSGQTAGPRDDAFRLAADDIRAMAHTLAPGTSAGFMIYEHLWARDFMDAIEESGGVVLMQGFLSPEAVAAVAA